MEDGTVVSDEMSLFNVFVGIIFTMQNFYLLEPSDSCSPDYRDTFNHDSRFLLN